MILNTISTRVTMARLCCDVDVGALAINLVGVIGQRQINFCGIILPPRPSDLVGVLHKIFEGTSKYSSEGTTDASLVYRTGDVLLSSGRELRYEDTKILDGVIRKVYLSTSRRLVGYIFDKVRGYTPTVIGYAGSVKGLRENKRFNDDSVLVLGASYCYGGAEKNMYIAAVADGVSSLETGYEASSLAVRGFAARLLVSAFSEQFLNSSDVYESYRITAEEINKINQTLGRKAASTFTAAVFPVNGSLHIVHVGDTRAYMYGKEGLIQLTEDHKIPGTHMITKALGSNNYTPQIREVYFEPGNTLLLASDGLYEVVGSQGLRIILSKFTNTTILVKELLKNVIKKAGSDDASVGIMKRLI